ncbi:hypothetical protein [Roseiconus lacunae]|uniref:hypothetical protein n=1 Tax=Roseiconus lacunae TaxID=2605694 RepID=UPI0011F22A50|nr:hypothetical protein [Roseiconus lacunae]
MTNTIIDREQYGEATITLDSLHLKRSQSQFNVSHVEHLFGTECPHLTGSFESIQGALSQIAFDDFDAESIGVAVGPGDGDLAIRKPVIHPHLFTVWAARRGRAVFLLGHFSQPVAARVADGVLRRGLCPIVATPYLAGEDPGPESD